MKQVTIFLIFLIWSTLSVGQTTIENFDNAADSTFEENVEGAPSYMNFTNETTDMVEGTGALRVKYSIGAFHPWGSFANAIYRVGDEVEPMDWSSSDSVSIWIKVTEAPTNPEYMVFRMHLVDQPSSDVDIEEYIYENTVLINETTEWMELKIPLIERETDGGTVPNDEGFVLVPTNWGGGTYNNSMFDRDKIVGYNLSAVTTGWTDPDNIPADSVEVLYDNFTRFGIRAVPYIFFNGMAVPTAFTAGPWGQSSVEVEEGAGAIEGTNAIKWVQGDEWSNGWTGVTYSTTTPMNMEGSFVIDSLKFKMKAEAGTGDIRMQFESSPDGKIGSVFTPIADGEWHDYSLALSEMIIQDDKSDFKSDSVVVVGFMAEGNGVAGRVIYIDDWWTGNPIFDVIPPGVPTNVSGIAGVYQNLVSWMDVENEDDEVYTVVYSLNPITSLDDEGLITLVSDISAGEQIAAHVLTAPKEDAEVSYYYGVYATDVAGNKGDLAVVDAAVTNTAEGISVIALGLPNFAADGDLSEWSEIAPIPMYVSDNSGTIVNNTTIDNDADLSLDAWVAVDDNYLYFAFDVEDDIVNADTTDGETWMRDSPDLFIGLYEHGATKHTSYKRGEEPDYHFRLSQHQLLLDITGGHVLAKPGVDYYWEEKFGTGYIVEGRVSLDTLAAIGEDVKFVPVKGMKIPIDYAINDADLERREGILTLAQANQDQSWNDPARWVHTWVGEGIVGVDEDDLAINSYKLSQNYPNPFNPSTLISYSLANKGMVTLKIYNLLGQEVLTLVNTNKNAGQHQVKFDASNLSSGLYIYKLQSGSFVDSKKMMLLK